jgi:hypothetical protein
MPIVYVHGVATRKTESRYRPQIDRLTAYLRHYVAPAISPDDPAGVRVLNAYWGHLGVAFKWGGMSRPRTPLLKMGATAGDELHERLLLPAELSSYLDEPPQPSGLAAVDEELVASGPSYTRPGTLHYRIADLDPEALVALLVTIIHAQDLAAVEQARLAIAVDQLALYGDLSSQLRQCQTLDEELDLIEAQLAEQLANLPQPADAVIGQGAGEGVALLRKGLEKAIGWASDGVGFATGRAVVEIARPALHDLATLFIGDVCVYLTRRGTPTMPGAIPRRVLRTLRIARELQRRRDGEPLVVISHSMGGQIMYDLLTAFIPAIPAYQDIRVDFWCAAASQVALFEEMSLLAASSPRHSRRSGMRAPVPDPRYLSYWWNVWDHNDVLSFSADSIFATRPEDPAGVHDESFNGYKMTLGPAHSAYLERPEFFRLLAERIRSIC